MLFCRDVIQVKGGCHKCMTNLEFAYTQNIFDSESCRNIERTPNSRADLDKNRAFRDKSMKLGTWILDILRIILRNGATYDLTFGDL